MVDQSVVLVLLLALAIDVAFGEPSNSFHPVAWMGSYLRWMHSRSGLAGGASFCLGLSLLALGMLLVAVAAFGAVYLLDLLPIGFELVLTAILFKPMLSLRALVRSAGEVRAALERQELIRARQLLGLHLVSRQTDELTEAEVAGATAESLAENLTDSVVAPILYFVLLGLPGAVLYRFVNTADAVVGYRTPELERFGKGAARLDDLVNLVPARLAAILLLLSIWLHGMDARAAWRTSRREARATPSPNAGWTMASVAGGLGICLDKRGAYVINSLGRSPTPHDIALTQRLVLSATVLMVLVITGLAHA